MTSENNPFAAPLAQTQKHDFTPLPAITGDGSYGLGIALGVVLGLWGWIGCMIFAKQETKRGALHGFLGRLGLTLVIVLIAAALN